MRFILPRFFINCERWKWNDDLRVFVSTFGHIKDEHKKNVAPKINDSGYFVVRVKDKWISVHRLVLLTWRPIPNDGEPMTVDHLDSNRRNNRLDNLEWVSQGENLRRANEMLCKNKEANAAAVKPVIFNSGIPVTWESLEEKFGLKRNKDKTCPEGLMEEIYKLYRNGTVMIFKGNSNTLLDNQWLMKQINNQSNPTVMVERFLKASLNKTGSYLGVKPRMYWPKKI